MKNAETGGSTKITKLNKKSDWTLCTALETAAHLHGQEPALSWTSQSKRHTINWTEYRNRILQTASSIIDSGGQFGETVAILGGNFPEHLVIDLATIHCGMVSLSLYPTLAPEQMEQILSDSKVRIIFVEGVQALQRVAALDTVKQQKPILVLVPLEGEVAVDPRCEFIEWDRFVAPRKNDADLKTRVAERVSSITTNTPAIYIYTSGTTGKSKGVALTHANLLGEGEMMVDAIGLDGNFRYVCYLPLAHIGERLPALYMAILLCGHVSFCPTQPQLVPSAREHRPTFFFGVPRVWEKLRSAIEQSINAMSQDARAHLTAAQKQLDESRNATHDPKSTLESRPAAITDLLKQFGLDQLRVAVASAAPLHPEVSRFFSSVGLDILQMYGLTETCGPAISERPGKTKFGSVGTVMLGAEMKLDTDGEILIKSPGNCAGYRNSAQATADLFTSDGWLRTGDIGMIDDEGFLFVTDRKKELIVSSAGKKIAPTAVESLLVGRSFISQALAFGDDRSYVVALLVPDIAKLTQFSKKHGLATESVADLIEHPVILQELQATIDIANSHLSRPEQIKKFKLLANEWDSKTGELTPTFKLRRKVIHEKYAAQIDQLYEES
ncbi:AMP-dependent synthetase/ligase [Paraburkholderia sp. C35]|uniref:AMP-dependent synthetase/ligase n=1 Tax=Paraburkholderia sp. C35 TaxID=2126993 RepID=UPI0013A554C6|nr:AMP-dependent synthetase/ligase [Paraburkholderia sp. C35]